MWYGIPIVCFQSLEICFRSHEQTRVSICYRWSDVDTGLESSVVVLGQELIKQQVELLFQLTRVSSQASESCGAAGKLLLGVRRQEPPPVRRERGERGGLRGQRHRREDRDISGTQRDRR